MLAIFRYLREEKIVSDKITGLQQLLIISGGQTGVDRMALEVARELGIPTGGSAPRDYLTENGPDPSLEDFGLIALPSSLYKVRTLWNVLDSDATVIYGEVIHGTQLTMEFCVVNDKPFLVNPTPMELADFITWHDIRVLNVAGNRASEIPATRLDECRRAFRHAMVLLGAVAGADGLKK